MRIAMIPTHTIIPENPLRWDLAFDLEDWRRRCERGWVRTGVDGMSFITLDR